jgi:fructoselysine 6-kinase
MRLLGAGDNVVDRYRDLGCCFQAATRSTSPSRQAEQESRPPISGRSATSRRRGRPGRPRRGGVGVERLRIIDGPNAWADVTVVDGDRVFVGADATISAFRLDSEDLAYAATFDLIHTGDCSMLEDQVTDLATAAPLSFDFSIHRERDYLEPILPHLAVACFSASDQPEEVVLDLLADAVARGPRLALATRGTAPALLHDGRRTWRQPVTGRDVVDTLGAGDSFIGRFLVGVIGSEDPDVTLLRGRRCSRPYLWPLRSVRPRQPQSRRPRRRGGERRVLSRRRETSSPEEENVGIHPVAGRPVGRLLVLVALASVAIAACSSGSTPSPSGAASPAPSSGASAAASTGTLEGKITFLHKYADPRYALLRAVVAAYRGQPRRRDRGHRRDRPGREGQAACHGGVDTLPTSTSRGPATSRRSSSAATSPATSPATSAVSGRTASPRLPSRRTRTTASSGVPFTLDAKYIVYNNKLFTDNGVATPTTLEDLLAACDLQTRRDGPMAFGNQFGWPAIPS